MNIGDRYYYTGDQANIEDFGTITNITQDKWGTHIKGLLDDGRIQNVSKMSFSKGVGQRFKLIDQYNYEREEAFKRMEALINRNKSKETLK